MGKIKNSLSTKIFLGIAAILLAVSLLMFGFLRIFMPKTYERELTAQFTTNLQNLTAQVKDAPMEQWESMLITFCTENNTKAGIFDENGKRVIGIGVSVYTADDGVAKPTDGAFATSVTSTFEQDGKPFSIVANLNAGAAQQMTGIFAKVFPYVFAIVLILSALAAFLYSRFLARPVVNISNVSKRMTALDMTWRCDVNRTDEIGILACNLNDMAARLDGALRELQSANEKLQADIDREREQDKRRRDFFSAISHELKTPVTILKGELDGMILNVGKFKDRDTYLQEAYQTTEAIEKLVREILTLAKLDTLSLDLRELSLCGLADECRQLHGALAEHKRIEIRGHYEANPIIRGDKTQMRTALSNIIGNAVKHSPENSVMDIHITEKAITVENTGVHIGEDELKRVWEPFYRTDKSRSRDTGGSGLGLYIVKSILDLHGFDYHLENTDMGMRFSILFH